MLGPVDDGLRLKEMEKTLRKWVAEGRVDDASVERWRDGARQLLQRTGATNAPQDWKCKVRTRNAADHDTMLAVVAAVCGERRSASADPVQVTDRRPRASVVQRRITLELAPELGIHCQEDIVRKWCESNLAEVAWHACIHRVRDGDDAWRDTAYIVYTQFALEPEDDTGRATGWWTFERDGSLPSPAPVVNVLWGKGPQGRAGTRALLESWRTGLVELQNEYLEAAGVDRRYTARAHRHDGAATGTPGRSMDAKGRCNVESSNATGLSSMAELGVEQVVEPWLARWREALTEEPEGERVGRSAASITEQWSAEEKRSRVRDPRPDVRALCAHARRWNRDMEKRRSDVERICNTWSTDEEGIAGVDSLIEDLDVHEIRLHTVATEQQRMWLEKAQQCGQVVKEAEEAVAAFRSEWDAQRINEVVRKWTMRLGAYVNECAACKRAWETLKEVSQERKWKLQDLGSLPRSIPIEKGERLMRVRTLVRTALSRSDNGDGDVGALLEASRLRRGGEYIRGEDAMLDWLVSEVVERIRTRLDAIWKAGRTIGVTATVPEERGPQAAQLAPTVAARWVGRDLAVVKNIARELWNPVQVPLRQFEQVAKRRTSRVISRAGPGEEDRAVAAAFSAEELAVLGSIGATVVQTVKDARSRVEAQDREFVKALRDTVSRVRGARDPRERSTLQTKLAEELAQERARTTLSRVEWMRTARAGGLGAMEMSDGVRFEAASARAFSQSVCGRIPTFVSEVAPSTDVRG